MKKDLNRVRTLIVFVILILSVPVLAEQVGPLKTWSTFNSSYGYQFKYPACWDVRLDEAGFEAPLDKALDIGAFEGAKCARPRLDAEGVNGVSFAVHNGIGPGAKIGPYGTRKEVEERINHLSKQWHGFGHSADWTAFNKWSIGGTEAVTWVEQYKGGGYNKIRWQTTVYCPNWWIVIFGPSISTPDQSYFEKFKKDDLAIPEPEKTIIESVRCTKPSLKPGMPYGGGSAAEPKKKK